MRSTPSAFVTFLRPASLLFAAAVGVSLSGACGGGAAEAETDTTATVAARDDGTRDEPSDGLAMTGLMGTISADAVRDTLQMRQDRFLYCFTRRLDAVGVLGGTIELSFRVKTDGSVLWVYPKRSTIGDRETERCILDVASTVRFRRPRGGEAEFTWPFEVAPPDDVRPPLNWTADRITPQLSQDAGLAARCRPPGSAVTFSITVYIAPGGAVLAAGGVPSELGGVDSVDCVLEAVRAWSMPDPVSYPAKITFDVL
jgi:hypothetical protein